MSARLSRRRFLQGAGGALLALPTLPSLLPRTARASTARDRCFFAFGTWHGGVWSSNMWPEDAVLSDHSTYAGRVIRHAALSATTASGTRTISPVLSASSTALTDRILARMNLIRGIDIPWYIQHHNGAHLGNFASNDGNGVDGVRMFAYPSPTIDQVLAWSPAFYPDVGQVVERSVSAGWRAMSWDHASPSVRSGPIQERYAEHSSYQMFLRLFRPSEAYGDLNGTLVDKVMEDYARLRSHSRLSTEDGRRLDEHMERLFELERKLTLEVACTPVFDAGGTEPAIDSHTLTGRPTHTRDPAAQCQYWSLFAEVIVAAMSCGLCRIATFNSQDTFSEYTGDWHSDIAHQAHLPDGTAQAILAAAHQVAFEGVFLDICQRMEAVDTGGGQTLLDDSLVVWSQESGPITHETQSMPIITAGSAGGALSTGNYVDYRDLEAAWDIDGFHEQGVPGLLFNQWLGTVLQTMGMDPSEYESVFTGDEQGGYGPVYVGSRHGSLYDGAIAVAGEPLPILT